MICDVGVYVYVYIYIHTHMYMCMNMHSQMFMRTYTACKSSMYRRPRSNGICQDLFELLTV